MKIYVFYQNKFIIWKRNKACFQLIKQIYRSNSWHEAILVPGEGSYSKKYIYTF